MTKAEYLKSIGYECWDGCRYEKLIRCFDSCSQIINIKENRFYIYFWDTDIIETQKDVDKLQIAFNNVKRDFEEMQKYD